jgi:outer membrane immunogenic protein
MLKNMMISVAFMSITGAALAADLPSRATPAAFAPAPVFSWTGFYVGLNAGYGGDKFRYPFDVGRVSGEASLTSSGPLGGAQIGYNWQMGNGFVIGAEADYTFTNIKGKLDISASNGGDSLSASVGSKLTSFGTVRARAGYAWDRALFYVTGGWAYGRVESDAVVSFNQFNALDLSRKVNQSGWTAGAGVEYAFTNNISMKTEYLYVDLGKNDLYRDQFSSLSVDSRLHLVRAGINYRF